MRIKDRQYRWKEGESVLFDDSWEHEVTNHANDIRVVLVVDVLRPMPPLPHALNRWITDQFIRRVYARGVRHLR